MQYKKLNILKVFSNQIYLIKIIAVMISGRIVADLFAGFGLPLQLDSGVPDIHIAGGNVQKLDDIRIGFHIIGGTGYRKASRCAEDYSRIAHGARWGN